MELIIDKQTGSSNDIKMIDNMSSSNNRNRNITSIHSFEHINLLWTDIAKWPKKEITCNATYRAAIPAKNIANLSNSVKSFKLYCVNLQAFGIILGPIGA